MERADPAPNQGRILVVEDESIVALALGEFLVTLGYEVIGPTGVGEQAVALAQAEHPDLVLMDVRLKGNLDGPATAHQIRRNRNVPFVFLTAHADEPTLARAREVEPHAYVIKPYAEHALAVTIQMALTRARAEQARASAEQARRRAEAWFAAILDHCHDGIVCVNRERRITVFNQGAERMFGYKSAEMLGQPLELLLPAEYSRVHRASVDGFEWNGTASRRMSGGREVRGRRRNGETFFAEVTISRVVTDEQEILTACVRDLTERRLLEEQFLQSQKLEVIGRFAASVAHDFNNLLTAIQTNTYLLKQQVSPPLQEHVEELAEAVQRGKALTGQVLGFARQEPATLQLWDLNELVARALPLLRRLLGASVALRTELDSTVGGVRADRNLIEQVLMNLVVNARDAMPHGGEILIRTSSQLRQTNNEGSGHPLASGRYSCIEVIDTGEGVPPELTDRVFEAFFTTKPAGVGTGLGLPTVRAIARRSGGDAFLARNAGPGATFAVLLPQVASPGETEPPTAPEDANFVGGNEHILVVEDDAAVARALSTILEQHGYRVRRASSFPAALIAAARDDEPLDLVLAAALLPGGSGAELAQNIAALRPGTVALLMTGYPTSTVSDGVARFDPESLLVKPFPPGTLLRALRRALDGRRSSAS